MSKRFPTRTYRLVVGWVVLAAWTVGFLASIMSGFEIPSELNAALLLIVGVSFGGHRD